MLHARLGPHFREQELLQAAYEDRAAFDYWAHDASIVPISDLVLHRWHQRRHLREGRWANPARLAWMQTNQAFADGIVRDLQEHGALRAQDLEDHSAEPWKWGYWTPEVSDRQTVARMLGMLWMTGRIGVSGRKGIERLWDVTERCLAPGALAAADARIDDGLSEHEATRMAVRRALPMLGVAKATHITKHFTRNRYPALKEVLAELTASGELTATEVEGCKGTWYATTEALDTAGELEPGRRTVALSPFDNVLCDRARTAELFGFDHRLEIYVPPEKRRWGYYVLPILHGERFVARADLKLDKDAGVLKVQALHEEPGRRAGKAITTALERLAVWRGATL